MDTLLRKVGWHFRNGFGSLLDFLNPMRYQLFIMILPASGVLELVPIRLKQKVYVTMTNNFDPPEEMRVSF